MALGCGAGSAPPPPPPLIEVTVKPATGSLVLGGQATFTAAVTNTIDAAVGWSVNGVPNGNTTVGTITPARVYRACRPAFPRHRANHRYQSCRPGKIRHRQSRNYERHHAELDPESPPD